MGLIYFVRGVLRNFSFMMVLLAGLAFVGPAWSGGDLYRLLWHSNPVSDGDILGLVQTNMLVHRELQAAPGRNRVIPNQTKIERPTPFRFKGLASLDFSPGGTREEKFDFFTNLFRNRWLHRIEILQEGKPSAYLSVELVLRPEYFQLEKNSLGTASVEASSQNLHTIRQLKKLTGILESSGWVKVFGMDYDFSPPLLRVLVAEPNWQNFKEWARLALSDAISHGGIIESFSDSQNAGYKHELRLVRGAHGAERQKSSTRVLRRDISVLELPGTAIGLQEKGPSILSQLLEQASRIQDSFRGTEKRVIGVDFDYHQGGQPVPTVFVSQAPLELMSRPLTAAASTVSTAGRDSRPCYTL